MTRHIVARLDEIPSGGRKIVKVAGREIGIFNVGGTFYALKNVCPHQGARVCLGAVSGTALPSRPQEFSYGLNGRILRCPWHGWEFDLTNGQSLFDADVNVATYPVEVQESQIIVNLSY